MTARSRRYSLISLVCSIAFIVGCGGGSSGGALSISTSTLPNGNVGTSYSTTVSATGGTSPYTWSLASGTLQSGLALDAGTGTIDGTPSATGTVMVTVLVTDSATPTPNTAKVTLSLTVENLTITTTSLPPGALQTPYNATLMATGGKSPYTWSLSAGSLPAGLTLTSSTGVISGTPTSGGGVNITIQVTDSESPALTFTKNFSFLVSPLSLLNNSLPNGLQGTAYSITLDGVGGVSPYAWSIFTGTLPAGLSLDPVAGTISGTPNGSGTSVFSVHVADSETPAEVVTKSFSLTIQPSSASSCAGAPTGNESLLHGNYALFTQGFQGGGSRTAIAIAGSFAANAAGLVTGGDIDVSGVTGSTHYTIASGSSLSLYTVGLDTTGAGNLGCVMLTTSVGTTMSFRFSLGGVSGGIASRGKIIEFDNSSGAGTIASGVMALQTATTLSPAYAFGLDGQTLGGSAIAEAGSFSASSSSISSAFADVDIAGTNSSNLSGGSGSITSISADGRGTASFSAGGVSFAWAIYIVNANEVYLVSTAFPAGGRALATSRTFTQSSLSGNYILYSTGNASCSGVSCSDVNLGLLNLTGGAASGPLWDYSLASGESVTSVSGGSYSVSSPSGRVAFTGVGSNGLISYLVSPAVDGISGITVGTDAGAHFGFATQQVGSTVPAEHLFYATLDPRYNAVTTYAGTASLTALGAITGTENDSSQTGNLQPSVPVARSLSLIANGTGSAGTTGGNNIATTDGSRLFWFDYGNGAPPVITVAEPQ